MDSNIRRLVLALMLGIAGAFLILALMGDSGVLPAPFPLMPN